MKRLARSTVFFPSCVDRPLVAVCEVTRRLQSSSSARPAVGDDEGVFTEFPGDAVATAGATSHRTEAGVTGHRRHHRRGGSTSEADGLLKDIFALEKQVAVKQRRQRLSVRASQLGHASELRACGGTREATSSSAVAQMMEAEGVCVRDTTPPRPPALSIPSPEETAAAASRARHFETGVLAFAASASPAAAAPTSSHTPSAALSSSLALPPSQSWVPPFALTAEQLRTSADSVASEVAFTLEELEDTLFSSPAEAEKDGMVEESQSSTHPNEAAPPPPPPQPPLAPPATPTLAVSPSSCAGPKAVVSADAAGTEERKPREESAGSNDALTGIKDGAHRIAHATPASTPLSAKPPRPVAATSGSAVEAPTASKAPQTRVAPSPLLPVLRCRVRGTAVVVTMSRAASSLRELVEALQEAVTFAESLPPLASLGAREVRLRVDTSAPECAGLCFIGVSDLCEVTAPTDERAEVQLIKDRLLRRIQSGGNQSEKKLRYVAEVQVAATRAPSTPAMLQDFAAELMLSCAVHEVHHVAQPNARLDGAGTDTVQLSFSGIGVGVFPCPATMCRVNTLVEKLLAQDDQRARLLDHFENTRGFDKSSTHRASASSIADVTANTLLCLHLMPAGVSTSLLAVCSDLEETIQDSEAIPAPTTAAVAQRKAPKPWMPAWLSVLLRLWAAMPNKAPYGGGGAAVRDASAASLSRCVTVMQVWSWLCGVVLQVGATPGSSCVALTAALRAAPLQRCQRIYARTTAPFGLQHKPPLAAATTSTAGEAHWSSPYVIEVTGAALAQTAVADLASEIRDQPSDVVLAVASSVPLEQRLKFLASLHLTDTGNHHQVTVLLSGPPLEVDECASLTRSSARLAVVPPSHYGRATVRLGHPSWLQCAVEVSVARSPQLDVDAHQRPALAEAATALQYVTRKWQRPCVVTARSGVGLALRSAAQGTQKYQHGRRSQNATVSHAPVWQQSLAPLVVLPRDLAGMVKTACPPPRCFAWAKRCRAGEPQYGLAFLLVLDTACQVLRQEVGMTSPEDVDILSIAALQLDPSAGGVFDAADRVCGDSVDSVLSAMEAAATEHQIEFDSLPLLRWMVEEQLLFYQLNGAAVARFAKLKSTQ
jgi:hypothetical protein